MRLHQAKRLVYLDLGCPSWIVVFEERTISLWDAHKAPVMLQLLWQGLISIRQSHIHADIFIVYENGTCL